MRPSVISVLALALAMPAVAQQGPGTSSTTTTVTGPSSSATMNLSSGNTHVTGSTVHDGASAMGLAAEDQAILSHLASTLVSDPAMAGAQVDVRVEKGHVTLKGTTRDAAQSAHAREVASSVAGEGNVTSRLSP